MFRDLHHGAANLVWISITALLALIGVAHAVPMAIPYVGLLSFEAGGPVNGTVRMTATLYSDADGADAIWGPVDLGEVVVNKGILSFVLLDNPGQPLATVLSGTGEIWLEIEVDDVPMSPRQQVLSVPFAVRSLSADQLAGTPASGFATAGQLATALEAIAALQQEVAAVQNTLLLATECCDAVLPANICLPSTPLGTPCDDGNVCTGGDMCNAGVCSGELIPCTDDNPCTLDTCDETLGCQHAYYEGTCDDGDPCTEDGLCVSGVCHSVPLDCDDNLACTDDWCESGQCEHALKAGYCNVNGECALDGAEEPGNPCAACIVSLSSSDWSDLGVCAAPVLLSAPVITGTPAPGEVLTGSGGVWSGYPTPVLAFQWYRNGEPISGATAATYTVQFGDVAGFLVVRVSATNAVGDALGESIAAYVPTRAIELVSVNSMGVLATGGASVEPDISADGRWVVWYSHATNLVPDDTNGVRDVFIRDRIAGTTERVSVSSSGIQGNGTSYTASVTGDGRFVVFYSESTNLVAGDTNGMSDIFVRDRQSNTTERVSLSSSGAQGNGHSYGSAISSDGRFVAFTSNASDLVPGDTNGVRDVFVRDRQNNTTVRVSVGAAGVQANSGSDGPAISRDGRYVLFYSNASNLVVGDTNGAWDVFLHDREVGTTERISVSSDGTQGNADSYHFIRAAISDDGSLVVFDSSASNLVPNDTNGGRDIFVRDRLAGTTTRVNLGPSGQQPSGSSNYHASISADGRFVSFYGASNNLVLGDTNDAGDIFVRDLHEATTVRLSVAQSGLQANASSWSPVISATGAFVAFDSEATNLAAGDNNGARDVFVAPVGAFPRSCLDYKHGQSGLPDGNYIIDPDGAGGEAPFTAYCDMTTDGGGWTLIAQGKPVDNPSLSLCQVGAVGTLDLDATAVSGPAKLSNLAINAVWATGTEKRVLIKNDENGHAKSNATYSRICSIDFVPTFQWTTANTVAMTDLETPNYTCIVGDSGTFTSAYSYLPLVPSLCGIAFEQSNIFYAIFAIDSYSGGPCIGNAGRTWLGAGNYGCNLTKFFVR